MRDQIPSLLSTEHSQVLEDVGDYKECAQESGKCLDVSGAEKDTPIRQFMSNRWCCRIPCTDSRTRFSPSVSRRIGRRVHPQALRPAPSLRLHWSPHVAVGPASAIQTEVPARLSGSAVRASGIDSPSVTWRSQSWDCPTTHLAQTVCG